MTNGIIITFSMHRTVHVHLNCITLSNILFVQQNEGKSRKAHNGLCYQQGRQNVKAGVDSVQTEDGQHATKID